MFELYERLMSRLRGVWTEMNLNQKVLSAGILAALLIAALYISTLSDRMLDYTVLFAQLNAKSASEIITRLEQQNIPYRLIQGGTAIEVPVDRADKMKIDLSAEGLPESGIVGYEILDTTNFGMSDYLQKVNYRRAIEGELSKTLRSIDVVESARVMLNIPEPSLYVETTSPPTAAVLLTLKRGRSLLPSNVEAIANLIASSVEGLEPKDVKIVDSGGTLLSKPAMDELTMQSSNVMELKFAYEKKLEEKVKQMLDGAFGTGIALVTVNADLDFDRIERVSTLYDQENSAIVGEERTEITNTAGEGGSQETVTTNYDTGRIVENLVSSPGSTVKKLTVSVMIDMRDSTWVDEEGMTHVEKVPWSEYELAFLRTISENAVGLNSEERGDRLEIVSLPFGAREFAEVQLEGPFQAKIVEVVKTLTMGAVILAALGLFWIIIRLIISTLDPSKIRISGEREFDKIFPERIEEEVEMTERSKLMKKIMTRVIKEPEITAKTIKSIYKEL